MIGLFGRKSPKAELRNSFDRESALKSKPRQMPVIRSEKVEESSLRVTVTVYRPNWQRILGAPQTFERSYVLDALGQEVYQACDGRTTVKAVIHRFANRHKVSVAEAQLAVTTYLKTLMSKGLVGMEVDRKST